MKPCPDSLFVVIDTIFFFEISYNEIASVKKRKRGKTSLNFFTINDPVTIFYSSFRSFVEKVGWKEDFIQFLQATYWAGRGQEKFQLTGKLL